MQTIPTKKYTFFNHSFYVHTKELVDPRVHDIRGFFYKITKLLSKFNYIFLKLSTGKVYGKIFN